MSQLQTWNTVQLKTEACALLRSYKAKTVPLILPDNRKDDFSGLRVQQSCRTVRFVRSAVPVLPILIALRQFHPSPLPRSPFNPLERLIHLVWLDDTRGQFAKLLQRDLASEIRFHQDSLDETVYVVHWRRCWSEVEIAFRRRNWFSENLIELSVHLAEFTRIFGLFNFLLRSKY